MLLAAGSNPAASAPTITFAHVYCTGTSGGLMAASSRGRVIGIVLFGTSILVALIAIAALVGALFLAESHVQSAVKEYNDKFVAVAVAKVDLPPGTTIDPEEHLETIFYPKALHLAKDADGNEIIVTDTASLDGRVPAERIAKGDPIRAERLVAAQSGYGLSALLKERQRAVQLDLPENSIVSGFIIPGDYVDVLYTGPDPKLGGQHTKTILQAQRVLAIGTTLNQIPGSDSGAGATAGWVEPPPSVTLAMSPEDAQLVTHASTNGVVTLTLRNYVDVTKMETHGTSSYDLPGATQAQLIAKPSAVRTARNTKATPGDSAAPAQPAPNGSKVDYILR